MFVAPGNSVFCRPNTTAVCSSELSNDVLVENNEAFEKIKEGGSFFVLNFKVVLTGTDEFWPLRLNIAPLSIAREVMVVRPEGSPESSARIRNAKSVFAMVGII